MREIKFRVWDIERKEWVKQTGNPYVFPFEGRTALICAGNATGVISDEDYSDYYILQQFTGLTDKNGKEIYEGGVVKYVMSYPDQEDELGDGVVSYDEGCAVVRFDKFNCACLVEPQTLEVIGNIHENPELLGKEAEDEVK